MAAYVGMRILEGAYTYTYAVTNRPDLKAGIDAYLIAHGRGDLIVTIPESP